MNPEVSDQTKIETLTRHWQRLADLGWLTIKNVFSEDPSPDPQDIAWTTTDWEYRRTEITWYLPRVAELELQELEETVVHELAHALVAPMEENLTEKHRKVCEFAVESVARALLAVKHTPNSPEWKPR